MGRRPNGRPVGRPPREYERTPPPRRVEWRCPKCETVNVVVLDDALYESLSKPVQSCRKCGSTLV